MHFPYIDQRYKSVKKKKKKKKKKKIERRERIYGINNDLHIVISSPELKKRQQNFEALLERQENFEAY